MSSSTARQTFANAFAWPDSLRTDASFSGVQPAFSKRSMVSSNSGRHSVRGGDPSELRQLQAEQNVTNDRPWQARRNKFQRVRSLLGKPAQRYNRRRGRGPLRRAQAHAESAARASRSEPRFGHSRDPRAEPPLNSRKTDAVLPEPGAPRMTLIAVYSSAEMREGAANKRRIP